MAEYTPEEERKYRILRNAYQKLDSLPLSFGMPAYNSSMTDDEVEQRLGIHLSDALRETGLSIDSIVDGSVDEMYFENRIVYHALRKFRVSSVAFFKFSTSVDGRSVDKTQIPKMLAELISEYDAEYKKWRLGHIGSLWNRNLDAEVR